ncbi:hypothetical protein ckin115_03680 [Helicobacter pylori]
MCETCRDALELKLCKIPTIGTQSENQTLPTGNISLGSPIVFSGWALHLWHFQFLKQSKTTKENKRENK